MSKSYFNELERFIESYVDSESGTQQALCSEKASRKVRVCVIDTGLDKTHPSVLAAVSGDRLRAVKTFSSDSTPNEDPTANDQHGHGTHVADLILRVAPEAELYVAKVANARVIPETDFHLIAKESSFAPPPAHPLKIYDSEGCF